MNALERMKHQQDLVTKVISDLSLKSVFSIQFTDYEVSVQTKFAELVEVEGADPVKLDDGVYIRMTLGDVELRAYRNFTEKEREEEEQKNASA